MKIKIIKAAVTLLTFAIFFALIIFINALTGSNIKKASLANIDRNVSINEPLGSNIKNVLTKDNHLYIVISGGGLPDRIVILNTDDGKIISSISLN